MGNSGTPTMVRDEMTRNLRRLKPVIAVGQRHALVLQRQSGDCANACHVERIFSIPAGGVVVFMRDDAIMHSCGRVHEAMLCVCGLVCGLRGEWRQKQSKVVMRAKVVE